MIKLMTMINNRNSKSTIKITITTYKQKSKKGKTNTYHIQIMKRLLCLLYSVNITFIICDTRINVFPLKIFLFRFSLLL